MILALSNNVNMKKPIVFVDYYQTLTADSYWRTLDGPVRNEVESYLYNEKFGMFVAWMQGEYTDKEIHQKLADKLRYDFNMLWEGFIKGARTVSVNPDVEAFLREHDSDILLILATDNFNCFDEFVVPNSPALSHFDNIYNSYNLKKTKLENGQSLFNDLADKVGGDLSSSYLLEDNPNICKAFEKVGKKAVQITDPQETGEELRNVFNDLK